MRREILIASVLVIFILYAIVIHPVINGYVQVSGNALGDLYPRWIGARELILHALDPYGEAVTNKIQTGFYGHPLEASDTRDPQGFAYPVYVVFLLWPTVWTSFPQVKLIAIVFLAAVTIASVFCWLIALRIKPRAWFGLMVLAVLFSPPVMQGLRLQQIGFLVAALIAGAAACVILGQLETAGILLAVATLKPQMVFLPLIWFSIWVFMNWKNRGQLLVWFGTTLTLLITAGEMISPGALSEFLTGLVVHRHYARVTFPELFFGRTVGLTISMLVLLFLVFRLWKEVKKEGMSEELFVAGLALVLSLELFIVPGLSAMFNFVLLLPSVLVL